MKSYPSQLVISKTSQSRKTNMFGYEILLRRLLTTYYSGSNFKFSRLLRYAQHIMPYLFLYIKNLKINCFYFEILQHL